MGVIKAQAQQNTKFEASVEPRIVPLNSTFTVTFTWSNAKGSATDFRPPSFSDFILRGGPNQSMSMSSVNGTMSQTISLSYIFQSKAVGKFSIGEARISMNNQSLKTKSLAIEVVATKNIPASKPAAKGEKTFIRSELSETEAYVGQQIMLNYMLYTNQNLVNSKIIKEPDLVGFFSQEIREFDNQPKREVVGGKPYTAVLMRRIVLFPQKMGKLRIEPMQVELGVAEPEQAFTGHDIFFEAPVQQFSLQTSEAEVNIKPLPEPKPEIFSGAVGHFSMNSRLLTSDVRVGESIEVKIFINGDGDFKRVENPKLLLNPSEDVEIYEPKIIREETSETSNGVTTTREISYFVLPQKAGNISISPAFVYFDTDKKMYVELKDTTYQLEVRAGEQRAVPGNEAGNLSDAKPIRIPTWLSWWSKILSVVASSLFLVYFYWRIRNTNKNPTSNRTTSLKLSEKQKSFAATASDFLEKKEVKKFYQTIADELRQAVGSKYGLSPADSSLQNIRHVLSAAQMPPEQVEEYIELVNICDEAIFGGQDKSSDMSSVLRLANDFLAS